MAFKLPEQMKRNVLLLVLKFFFKIGWRPIRTGFGKWEINRYILDDGKRPLGASGVEVFRRGWFVWLYVEVGPMYARANKYERANLRVRKLVGLVYRLLSF